MIINDCNQTFSCFQPYCRLQRYNSRYCTPTPSIPIKIIKGCQQRLRVFINISVYIVQPTQWNQRPVDGGGGEEGEEGERRSPVGFICIAVFLDLSLPALGRPAPGSDIRMKTFLNLLGIQIRIYSFSAFLFVSLLSGLSFCPELVIMGPGLVNIDVLVR